MLPAQRKSAGHIIRKICVQGHFEIEALQGETLLFALLRAGILVSAPCGAQYRCGKCKVRILKGRVRSVLSGEISDGISQAEVLACASIPETDLQLALVSENAYHGGVYDEIIDPKLGGQISRAGLALDIGTTTMSARLVDLDSGRELDTYSGLNQQRVFGADVMSRIGAARAGKTEELFNIITRQTGEILSFFQEKFNLSSIESLAVSANTTMLHLFANVDPSAMGEIPFTPVFLEEREYIGSALSLPVAKASLFPSISAFIGGDIVSGLAEIKILDEKEIWFRYAPTNSKKTMTDVVWFFRTTYFPENPGVEHSGFYKKIFLKESEPDKLIWVP